MQKSNVSSEFIDIKQVLNENLPQDDKQAITCMICMGIVVNAIQCKTCETVFCEKQIIQNKTAIKCPICKENNWKQGSNIHRSYKSKLASLILRCDQHNECRDIQYTYQKYLAHKQIDRVKQTKSQIKKGGYYQFSFEEKNNWINYSPNFNSVANLYLQQGLSSFTIGMYLIDMQKMIQTNIDTGFQRQIKTQLVLNRIQQYVWTANVQDQKYTLFDEKNSIELQKGYQQFINNNNITTMKIKVIKYTYQINFSTMQQINTFTKRARKISRTMI